MSMGLLAPIRQFQKRSITAFERDHHDRSYVPYYYYSRYLKVNQGFFEYLFYMFNNNKRQSDLPFVLFCRFLFGLFPSFLFLVFNLGGLFGDINMIVALLEGDASLKIPAASQTTEVRAEGAVFQPPF